LAGRGHTARVRRWRDGVEGTVAGGLVEAPQESGGGPGPGSGPGPGAKSLLGLDVKALTPELARQLGIRSADGVVVAGVESGSPAERSGIQPGDVVRELNRQRVRTPADFERLARALKDGDRVMLLLQREQSPLFVAFTLGP